MAANKLLSMLGLAAKAGRIASGEFQTEEAAGNGKAQLVLVSSDAAAGTVKKFRDMCAYREIPFFQTEEDMESLGRAIGKECRSSLAVTDCGLAAAVQKLLPEGNNERK